MNNPEMPNRQEATDNQIFADPMLPDAMRVIIREGRPSASFLQDSLNVNYNRARKMIDSLERAGMIGPMKGPEARREILQTDMSVLERQIPVDQEYAYPESTPSMNQTSGQESNPGESADEELGENTDRNPESENSAESNQESSPNPERREPRVVPSFEAQKEFKVGSSERAKRDQCIRDLTYSDERYGKWEEECEALSAKAEKSETDHARIEILRKRMHISAVYLILSNQLTQLKKVEESLVGFQKEYNGYLEEYKRLSAVFKNAEQTIEKDRNQLLALEGKVDKLEKMANKDGASETDKGAYRMALDELTRLKQRIDNKESTLQTHPDLINEMQEKMNECAQYIEELDKERIRYQIAFDEALVRIKKLNTPLRDEEIRKVKVVKEPGVFRSTMSGIGRIGGKVSDKTTAFWTHPVGRFIQYPFVFASGLLGTMWKSFKSYAKNHDKLFGGHDHLHGWKTGAGKRGEPDSKK